MVAAANAAGAAEATATITRWAAREAIDNEKELGGEKRESLESLIKNAD